MPASPFAPAAAKPSAPVLETPSWQVEPPRPPSEALKKSFEALDAIPAANAVAPAPEPAAKAPEPAAPPVTAPTPEAPLAGSQTSPAPAAATKPSSPLLDDLAGLAKPKAAPATPAPEPELKNMSQLRAAYENLKKEREADLKWRQEHEPKLAELSKFDPKKIEEEWTGKLSKVEQAKLEAENELRFANFQRSSEFKEKYEQPIVQALAAAKRDLDGITVKLEDGNTRPATMADVETLQRMSLGQAAEVAAKAFGNAAPYVMQHRNKLLELSEASNKALDEWKVKGSEREMQMKAAQESQLKAAHQTFDNTINELETGYPEMFGADPSDPSSKELLKKGHDLVSMAFKGVGIPDGISPQERTSQILTAQSHTAARARAFGPTFARLQRALNEKAELAKKLEAYEKADPAPKTSTGERPKEKQPVTMDSVLQQLANL